ncbi:MAG TPA: universal stress protein [Methylomirabilota bacterium]|nr:universal stress protein [Methylomirabilota bacterium]
MTTFRRILHPTDFSRASAPALRRAVALARACRAPLVLLHVMTPPFPFIGEGAPPSGYADLLILARRSARRRLAAALARVRRERVRGQAIFAEGLPADEILRAARRARADLIVMGTHGRTGVSRVFMGSVAERVVRESRCPVLTVRAHGR